MNTKAKLATILRRMADRLAPAPAGHCGSGATWFDFTVDVPAGATSFRPVITGGGIEIDTVNYGGAGLVIDSRFEQGEGWSPA